MRVPWADRDDHELLVMEVAELREAVKALECQRAVEQHVHDYKYSKTRLGSPDSFGGVSWFWSWKCERDACPQPSGGTNHVGGIPDHFPVDLR